MAATNDITGDSLRSRMSNEKFKSNYDQIDWSKKSEVKQHGADNPGKEPDTSWQHHSEIKTQ